MNEIELSVEEFVKAITSEDREKECFSETTKKIIRFYKIYKNQKVSYVVSDKDSDGKTIELNLTLADKQLFHTYGIKLKSYISNTKVDRKYILIIPKSKSLSDYKSEDFENKYKNAIEEGIENLPSDVQGIVNYADDNILKNYDDFEMRTKIVRSYFPNSNPLYAENKIKQDRNYKENGDKILEEYKKDFEKFIHTKQKPAYIDITDIISDNRALTCSAFNNKCREIENLIRENKGCIPVLYYNNKPEFLERFNIFAVYFQYFYNVQSVLYSSSSEYLQELAEMYYNETEMMLEDRIKYILNFPTYTYRLDDIVGSYFMAFARKCEAKVSLCPLDNIDSKAIIKINNFNFSKYKIIPIEDLYPLHRTKNMHEEDVFTYLDVINNYRKISNLFIDFENALDLTDNYLNICNTCLVSYNGQIYICYVEKLNAKIKGYRYLEDMNFKPEVVIADGVSVNRDGIDLSAKLIELETKDIGKYTPIDSFADANKYKFILTKRFRPAIKKIDPSFSDNEKIYKGVSPLKLTSKIALPIRKLFNSGILSISYNLFKNNSMLELFHEVGLHYSMLFRFRLNGVSCILDVAPRRSFRANSYFDAHIELDPNEDASRFENSEDSEVFKFTDSVGNITRKELVLYHVPVIGMYGGIHTYVDSSDDNKIIITEKFLAKENY